MRPLLKRPRYRKPPQPRPRRAVPRQARYYLVDGLDLRAEMERLCRLEALGGPSGGLCTRAPDLTVRRAAKRPRSRLGFAVPDENRLSVTVYPGIRRGDVEETLLHELVHLAVGSSPGARRWHGREFATTLRRAMAEGYGVRGVRAANSYHGAYADALERRHSAASRRSAALHPGQLELTG